MTDQPDESPANPMVYLVDSERRLKSPDQGDSRCIYGAGSG